MKNIFRISLLALFIGTVSCEDATDIIQESELSEDVAYQTVDDLRSGLIGVYAAYGPDSGGNGAGNSVLFNDLFTDNLKRGASSSGQGNQVYSFIMQPGTGFPTSIWGSRYSVINFANRVLRAWDRIYPTLETEAERNDANEIKAQLLAMRGFMHFELLQYFAPSYTDLSQPGVIIMDFVPEITQVFPRNTVGEVFTFVDGDLAQAAQLMGDTFDTYESYSSADLEEVFYINPDVIKAMQARVALFEGNYGVAETLANELVQAHPLAELQAYQNMFLSDDLSVSEQIWSLSRRLGNNRLVALYAANGAGGDGSPFFEMSNGLYNLLSNNDVRKLVLYFGDESEFVATDSPENFLLIGKYQGTPDGAQINDFKVFRSSEMQLIKAECEARGGNLTAAANSIKALRDKRYINDAPAPVYANLDAALTDILLERRLELAFEGHRYLDLKRLNRGISRNGTDCASFSAPCELNPGDYRFTLPIPNTEISANPTIEQNPGY
ncbi:RagB/SusD family nutrient uptake outer membrane protein [Flavobacterium alkalisoli]|uniref:RagB/SusD family nutrient uptake outer membrane protein n=1 Tax=Flavobacterium alkalisoli TaxID=2602769 RepID=A0A5B9FQW9_9FLAO|nr:RagB/SusD family nutrient uptake outer membrane protein [Flavobacterium alkalisoli]QEE48118.1 RagB/SusD family nutrient uptake outer membrane protein [Flavobacterium alkalisoli]